MKLFELSPLPLGDYGDILCHGSFSKGKLGLSGCYPFEPVIIPMGKLCVSDALAKEIRMYFGNHVAFSACNWDVVVAKNWRDYIQGTTIKIYPPGNEPINYLSDGDQVTPSEQYHFITCRTIVELKSPSIDEVLRDPSGELGRVRRFQPPLPDLLPPIFAGRFFGSVSNYFVTNEFLSVIDLSALGDVVELIEYSTETGTRV